MKVMLIRDVNNLGRAGDLKIVSDGYARNYLLPRAFAVPATSGVQKQVDNVRAAGDRRRERENVEKADLAKKLDELRIEFPVLAGDQGKLYGSITNQMIADAIKESIGETVDRRDINSPSIRELGVSQVPIRLTADLVPTVTVVVYQDGELVDENAVYQETLSQDLNAENVLNESVDITEQEVDSIDSDSAN